MNVANGHINFGFSQKETGDKSVAMATTPTLFFLVPSLKNNAEIFLEIILIQCFIEELFMSSLSSFARYKNVNISKTKKDIPKRKTAFFFTLGNLSNKWQ